MKRSPSEEHRSGDALFVVDEELRVKAWNAAAEQLTGVAEEAALGRPCWSVLGGVDDDGSVVCHARCPIAHAALRRGDVSSRPLLIRTTSGRRRVVASTISVGAARGRRLVHLLRPAPAAEPHPSVPPQVEQLTPREREVLELLAGGLEAGAIARALGISVSTVRTHVRHILTTLGVHTQLAAVALAYPPRP